MRLSQRYDVPARLALLYDFLNSIDRRRYMDDGVIRSGADEFATVQGFRDWMIRHSLDVRQIKAAHTGGLRLRDAVRALLKVPREKRQGSPEAAMFDRAATEFPLTAVSSGSRVAFRPMPGSTPVGRVVVELFELSVSGDLDRLKMCASEECEWIFFDRSKPSNRKWCSSERCGNREKTRAYRARQRGHSIT